MRVGTGGVWLGISRTIILIVELSAQRRKVYELDAHEEVFNAAVCNVKDAVVETVATVTSVLGMLSYELQPAIGTGTRSAKTDPRFHARSVMVLAAATNFVSSLFMAPLYSVLAMQKTVTCIANDVVLIVSNIADPDSEPGFVLGSHAQSAATDKTVGMCLSLQMGEALREVSTSGGGLGEEVGLIISYVPPPSPGAPRLGARERARDADTVCPCRQINDLKTRLPFEPLQHSLDAAFAYAIGIVTSMMDVLQSYDLDNCKLPTVGGGDLFKCVCGDTPLAIPTDKRFVYVSDTISQRCFSSPCVHMWSACLLAVVTPAISSFVRDRLANRKRSTIESM